MHRYLRLCVFLTCSTLLAACQPGNEGKPAQNMSGEQERHLLQQARSVEKGGDLQAAIGLYRQAIDASKESVSAHLALARLYAEQGDMEAARRLLNEAKERQPNHPDIHLQLGNLAIGGQNAEEALGHFESGLAQWPKNIDLLNGRGVALDMLGRHEEAQAVYRQALEQEQPQSEFIRNNLALSYIMAGRYDDAIHLLESIDNVKDFPVMRQNLALAYGLKGNMDKAREWGRGNLSEAEMNENIEFYRNYRKQMQP